MTGSAQNPNNGGGLTGNVPDNNNPGKTPADHDPAYLLSQPTVLDAQTLVRPTYPADRPARMTITTYTRRWPLYRNLGGDQTRIPAPVQPAGVVGGQQPWSNWDPRTFRNLPVTGWDDPMEQLGPLPMAGAGG